MNPASDRNVIQRRDFLAAGALAVGAVGLGLCRSVAATTETARRFPLIVFTKPFQKLDAEQTADLIASVGWDGVECPVRSQGQIEPERAPDELPGFVEVLRKRQRDVHIVATDILSLKTPHAESLMRTLAKLGIKRFRLGFFVYPPDTSPVDHLKELAPALKDLADACKDLGLQAGFQNHSGARYVGAPVWDVYSMIQTLDPRAIGFCFDIGHATVEGGLSWPIEAKLAEPFYTAILVKDFYWKKTERGWTDNWCPLGEGMVNPAFFEGLKKTSYRGPICQHLEYDLGDEKQMLAHMHHDFEVLQRWLA